MADAGYSRVDVIKRYTNMKLAKKLVELGLAEWRQGKWSDGLVATQAGKDAVHR